MEAAGWRCPELPVLVTAADAVVCGAAHILGRLSRAQCVCFPLFMLLPGGRCSPHTRRDSQPLWSGCRVWRGAMVRCRPMYNQYILSCLEEQTPDAELWLSGKSCCQILAFLNCSRFARTGFIFVVSSCLCCCRAPEQLAAWSVSNLREEGRAVLNSWLAGFWRVPGTPQLQNSFCPISFPACGNLFQLLYFSQTRKNQSL